MPQAKALTTEGNVMTAGSMEESELLTRSNAVRQDSQIRRAPNSAGLYDVLDLIRSLGLEPVPAD